MSDKEHARDEYKYEHEEKFEEERMYHPEERENPMRYDGMRAKPRGYGMRQPYRENYRGEEYPREHQGFGGGKHHGAEYNYGGYPHHGGGKHEYGPHHQRGNMRDMMGMDGYTGLTNWLNRPKVNNFLRGVGLLTVGVILAPTLAKVLRPLAVSTVQGAMGMVDDMKGIVDDAKDEVEDIFAEAKWDDEHEESHKD